MVDEAVTYNVLSLLAYIKHQLRLMYFVHAPVLYVKLKPLLIGVIFG